MMGAARQRKPQYRRPCWHCGRVHDPWTATGRFCSTACAAAFRKKVYAEAVARHTSELDAAIRRGQERARVYRESAEYQSLVRKSSRDLLRVERALSQQVKS